LTALPVPGQAAGTEEQGAVEEIPGAEKMDKTA